VSEQTGAQWPLTAAATGMLLDIPSANARRGWVPDEKAAAKLALKELIFRGSLRVAVERRRRRDRVTLTLGPEVVVPTPLKHFNRQIRRKAPGDVKEVVRAAAKLNYQLFRRVEQKARDELTGRELIEQREERRLRLFSSDRWVRTAAGDAWASDAEAHLARLERLSPAAERDPAEAVAVAVAAGAVVVLVPAALGPLERVRHSGGYAGSAVPAAAVGPGGEGFDPFAAVDALVEAVGGGLDAVAEGIDSGLDAVSSALDSVSGSIDAGVGAGVDSGGGGGGDGGGGGGDGGGGGG